MKMESEVEVMKDRIERDKKVINFKRGDNDQKPEWLDNKIKMDEIQSLTI